jgi:cytidyltransferase-like protein
MTKLPQTPYETVCVSGGFDPVHIGHLRMIQEAAQYGEVIVIVNSDEWLMRKKGYIFMPFKERCEILQGFTGVRETVAVEDNDNTVCEALRRLKPTYFANGGDRKTDNTPEMEVCNQMGTQLLWNIGGGKIQSSSTLVGDSGIIADGTVAPACTTLDGVDLTPSRVEILTSGDVAKNGDY